MQDTPHPSSHIRCGSRTKAGRQNAIGNILPATACVVHVIRRRNRTVTLHESPADLLCLILPSSHLSSPRNRLPLLRIRLNWLAKILSLPKSALWYIEAYVKYNGMRTLNKFYMHCGYAVCSSDGDIHICKCTRQGTAAASRNRSVMQ